MHGLRLFLLSLAMLFGASLIGYVAVGVMAVDRAGELPPLPRALWLSTLLLLASSGTVQSALAAARRGDRPRLRTALAATTLLGAGFLAVQVACWMDWAEPMQSALRRTDQVYLLTGFYVLTALHAAHVVGGLVPMAVVTARAWRGRYGPANHAGVLYVAVYWHFLDAVWLALFATLLLAT